jgi:hypothetical protein
MRPVMPPRFIRPRLLLLPLLLGALAAPLFLTTSTTPDPLHDVHADAVCKNERPARNVSPPHDAPTCVNCRAPLLDGPLVQVKPARATIVALPPAA